jgi:hypothetical protein
MWISLWSSMEPEMRIWYFVTVAGVQVRGFEHRQRICKDRGLHNPAKTMRTFEHVFRA